MRPAPLAILLALLVCSASAQAQKGDATSRYDRQHKKVSHLKKQLKQTEESIKESLEGDNPGNQRSALQTLRDLEHLFPEYSFSDLLPSLEDFLKNENADPVARKLAALALDELHSDAGDAVIRDVAESSDDKGLQALCEALLVGKSED